MLEVRALDRLQRREVVLHAPECGLGYRDSLFRRAPDRYVITALGLRLAATTRRDISYPSLRIELERLGIALPSGPQIARAVRRVRRRRLPDPVRQPNLGSFFHNPVVDSRECGRLAQTWPDMPRHDDGDGAWKLSAGWLIERCGLKGARVGNAAVSERHALVLVNLGAASARDFLELIDLIRERVLAIFGVLLQLEPRLLPGP
jgi:UDP-N-acetylmuramate dehydrogenase